MKNKNEKTLDRARLIPFILAAVIIIIDQVTKIWVVKNIPLYIYTDKAYNVYKSFFNGFINIIHVRNLGVAFSIGYSWPVALRKIVFSVILGLLGMAMLCFGYLAGSASDDPDSGYYFISMIGIFPIFGIMHMWMSNSNENDDDEYGTIRIPQSIIDFDKKNYTVIESELVSAGFVNVKTVPLKDLAFGVFTKPGTVESITINGIPVSSFKKRYQPDSSVIITYHSK